MEIQNHTGRVELHNCKKKEKHSNLITVTPTFPTPTTDTTTTTKPKTVPTRYSKPPSIQQATTTYQPQTFQRLPPPVFVPSAVVQPVVPVVAAPQGGGGGGGGGSESQESEKKAVETAGVSKMALGISLLAGAGAGYLIAGKLKKNSILGSVIGAVVGVASVYAYNKFFTGEKKSGFVSGSFAPSKYHVRKCWRAGSHGMEQVPCNDSTK